MTDPLSSVASTSHAGSLGKLAAALAAVQGQLEPAKADAENPHYRSHYATLASVWDACRDALAANGLAVVQLPSADGNQVRVETVLIHSSGESISSVITLQAKDAGPQPIGSCISYGRRYGLAAMVGISTADDDAESATDHSEKPTTRDDLLGKPSPPSDGQRYVTDVEEHSGTTKAGKPWTKWRVSFSDGTRAATFDSTIADNARHAMNNQTPVEVSATPADNPKWDPNLEAIRPASAITQDDLEAIF